MAMQRITDVLPGDELARVKSLHLYAKETVEGFCSGIHASPHKGFSVEFKQHRPYVAGDEIRNIDWKVFGRSDRFYIREFEEETNLQCTLICDVSGSMDFTGEGGVTKHDYAQQLSACIAYLMMAQADSVGLFTIDQAVREYLPHRSRASHLNVLMAALARAKPGAETELGTVLASLVPRLKRRGLVVLISDLFGDVDALIKAISHLRFHGHEVLAFQIWDRDELEFPFRQWTKFINLENADDAHMVDPSALRKSYLENLADFRERLKSGFRRHRVDHLELVTDQPVATAFRQYLATRARSAALSR